MKILMLSIFAPHFFNWTEQLKDSGHEIYWLDVFDSNTKVEKIDFVQQIIGWRYKWDYPGRYFIKKRFSILNNWINKVNQRDLAVLFEKIILDLEPDIVHSFVLQSGAYPINKVMQNYPNIPWVYSSWGSDLFYRSKDERELLRIKEVLPNISYLFTDCKRDFQIALENGFNGAYLGAFPGGGGYDLESYRKFEKRYNDRNIILIKGYQGVQGKCNIVLEALRGMQPELSEFEIIVFGANSLVNNFVREHRLDTWENFRLLNFIPHKSVMRFLGASRVYIGNSISDGMPNTLLEAIVMKTYPIQSNPGGATAELVEDGKGGLLIEDPSDPDEISEKIIRVLKHPEKIKKEIAYNNRKVRPLLDRKKIKKQILNNYNRIEEELKTIE